MLAKMIAKSFGLSDRDYRKALVKLRARIRIIENNLREKDYTFDYAKQPSKAMFKYRKAFLRNDGERYGAFLEKVERGEAELHTGTLMPYELVERAYACSEEERRSLDITWRMLEDFTTDENALVVADGSGSMYWNSKPMPAAVAQSLAIYFGPWTSPGVRWRTSQPMKTRLSWRTAPAPCTGAASRCPLRLRSPLRFTSQNIIKENSTITSLRST